MDRALSYIRAIAQRKIPIFFHRAEYRSDSENGRYAASIDRALKNQKAFDNFKRDKSYQEILEHVSRTKGEQYLEILQSRDDGILHDGLHSVLISDDIGNPIKHRFEGFSIPLSPTTLRYLKVASDLRLLFGEELGNVAEIGCGYGGQALVNDQLLNVTSATLFDLPIVTKLIERYLDSFLLNGGYRATSINKEISSIYDLVISNYAFSELPRVLQVAYIKKVIGGAPRGYLTMNSGTGSDRSDGKLTLQELQHLLPRFEVFENPPHVSPFHYIIVWGHNAKLSDKYFVRREV